MAVNTSTGRITFIACDFNSPPLGFVATSDDGGQTWTKRENPSLGYNFELGFRPETVHLTYVTGTTWLLSASKTTGGNASEVWRSTDDAVTWTKVATLTASALGRIATLGSILVATAILTTTASTFGDAVYSLDGGVTWRPSQHLKGTAIGAVGGDGGVLIVTSLYAYRSLRVDPPTWSALT